MSLPLPISFLFAAQVGSCFFLTGLIWVVQLIYYPAFAVVAAERFTDFHAGHSRRISWIVGPPMLAELGSAIVLFWLAQNWWWGLNLVSVGAIWLSTAFALVPCIRPWAKGKSWRSSGVWCGLTGCARSCGACARPPYFTCSRWCSAGTRPGPKSSKRRSLLAPAFLGSRPRGSYPLRYQGGLPLR